MSDEPDPAVVGRRIKKFRQQAELSLSELATRSGISKGYLWELEQDSSTSRPSAQTLYALAQELGVTMSDLLGRKLLHAAAPKLNPSLRQFAESEGLPEADVQMLASIRFRGEQPQTLERWRYIYDAIRMSRDLDGST